jgi:Sugar phosphate isomerases/epimerases
MKLSFSTLGCPDWSFGDIFSVASDLGYNGIEIRGIADEIYAPKIEIFSKANIEKTKAKFAKAHIEIPILTTGAYLCGNDNIESAEFEVKDYVMLAQSLGVKYVRVLGEKDPHPDIEMSKDDFDALCGRYSELCKFAAAHDVGLLIETNGFLAETAHMKALMERVNLPNAGVIWDIHHPFRFYGESIETTVANIGKYIKHVHVKDSVKGSNGKITYMLTGYGDVPVSDALKAMSDIGYDGYVSYEWVKRWARELAEPGIAFYQYIEFMRNLDC